MAKVVFKDNRAFQLAKKKACGTVNYRRMKDGRIVAAKWPTKRKKKS